MLPESRLRSIPSPSDGPSTHRLQIEVRICRGLWHFSRYELPERLRSFVTPSFKVHIQVDLWWSMESLWDTGVRVMRKCTNIWTRQTGRNGLRDYLSALGAACFHWPFLVFQIHLWGPFYGCLLFLLFLIKRKYWCLPDLLIGAVEKFMGCVFSIEAAFELSLT